MNDDEGLRFIVSERAWWFEAVSRNYPNWHPEIMVMGDDWSFRFTEHDLHGLTLKLEMFSDAFGAFADVPQFFRLLEQMPPATIDDGVSLLQFAGFRDVTPTKSPYE